MIALGLSGLSCQLSIACSEIQGSSTPAPTTVAAEDPFAPKPQPSSAPGQDTPVSNGDPFAESHSPSQPAKDLTPAAALPPKKSAADILKMFDAPMQVCCFTVLCDVVNAPCMITLCITADVSMTVQTLLSSRTCRLVRSCLAQGMKVRDMLFVDRVSHVLGASTEWTGRRLASAWHGNAHAWHDATALWRNAGKRLA